MILVEVSGSRPWERTSPAGSLPRPARLRQPTRPGPSVTACPGRSPPAPAPPARPLGHRLRWPTPRLPSLRACAVLTCAPALRRQLDALCDAVSSSDQLRPHTQGVHVTGTKSLQDTLPVPSTQLVASRTMFRNQLSRGRDGALIDSSATSTVLRIPQ